MNKKEVVEKVRTEAVLRIFRAREPKQRLTGNHRPNQATKSLTSDWTGHPMQEKHQRKAIVAIEKRNKLHDEVS